MFTDWFVLTLLLPGIVLACIVFLLFRVRQLRRRIEDLERAASDTAPTPANTVESHLRDLIRRVYALEHAQPDRAPAPAPPPPVAQPVRIVPPPPRRSAPEPAPPPPPVYVPPDRSWRERLAERLQGEEWETLIGGSWLNKLGVLITIIGLALFLRYSLSNFGPAGRIALGTSLSLVMLVTGVLLERRPRYLVYARGLLGGGWAALYFTAYAAHSLDAARVIDSPFTGALLLAAVACGMIGHSLRYRSQVVTGMAYILGFLSLAITPLTTFSVVALIPLAASLAFVAHRFRWSAIAAFGVVATYGVYLLSVANSSGGSLALGQTVLLTYWILFETLDLSDAASRRPRRGLAHAVFPLNALGFVAVSAMQWSASSPRTIHELCAIFAAVYLASALARARLRPPSSFGADDNPLDRAWAGGYEAPVTLAAILGAVGIVYYFTGLTMTVALLAEAELLFLAGRFLDQSYLRLLGGAAFLFPLGRIGAVHINEDAHTVIASRDLLAWSPVALLAAALLYLNRTLRASARLHGYAAAFLLVLILGYEMPAQYLGPAWLLLAVALLETGLTDGWADFRHQAYGAALLSFYALAQVNILGAGLGDARTAWGPQLLAFAAALAASARLIFLRSPHLPEKERTLVRDILTVAANILLATFLWNVLPAPLVALAWALQGLLCVELGLALSIPSLCTEGHLVGAAAFGRLFMANFTGTGSTGLVSHRLLTVAPVIALHYYLWSRLRGSGQAQTARVYLWSAALLAAVLMRFEFGRVFTVTGWSVSALALLYLGLRWNLQDLRWQSYILAVVTFVRCWSTNFYIPESLGGWRVRVLTAAVVIACFYLAEFLSPRRLQGRERYARSLFSVLASALLALLLFYEASGSWLTMAWGLEGVILLMAGFPTRERSLRLSGMLLLLLCIGKLFFYDFRHLDTPYRILSFLVLGLFLLGVSWIYTRFREVIRRYL